MRSRWVYTFQIVYALLATLFVAGVLYQVYLAGLVVVARTSGWEMHSDFGHALGLPLLLMLVLIYLARMPRRVKALTWLLFGVYVLQADVLIFMRSSAPLASALHPVLALLDFAIGWRLTMQAWAQVRAPQLAPQVQPATD